MCHLTAVSTGHCRRPVEEASDRWRNSLLLILPVYVIFYQISKKKKSYFFFIFDSDYFQVIQTTVFYEKTRLKCLSIIYSCFQTSRCLVNKTKIKAKEKLTIKKWPQTFDRMDRLDLRICKRFCDYVSQDFRTF